MIVYYLCKAQLIHHAPLHEKFFPISPFLTTTQAQLTPANQNFITAIKNLINVTLPKLKLTSNFPVGQKLTQLNATTVDASTQPTTLNTSIDSLTPAKKRLLSVDQPSHAERFLLKLNAGLPQLLKQALSSQKFTPKQTLIPQPNPKWVTTTTTDITTPSAMASKKLPTVFSILSIPTTMSARK